MVSKGHEVVHFASPLRCYDHLIEAFSRVYFVQKDDLDLHVITPGGEEIYFANPIDPVTGGNLDEDKIPEFPGNWVENINFPIESAPDGTYTVWVDQFALVGTPDPFKLLIAEDANGEEPGEIIFEYDGPDGLNDDETSPFFLYLRPDGVVVVNEVAPSLLATRVEDAKEKKGHNKNK